MVRIEKTMILDSMPNSLLRLRIRDNDCFTREKYFIPSNKAPVVVQLNFTQWHWSLLTKVSQPKNLIANQRLFTWKPEILGTFA